MIANVIMPVPKGADPQDYLDQAVTSAHRQGITSWSKITDRVVRSGQVTAGGDYLPLPADHVWVMFTFHHAGG